MTNEGLACVVIVCSVFIVGGLIYYGRRMEQFSASLSLVAFQVADYLTFQRAKRRADPPPKPHLTLLPPSPPDDRFPNA